MPDAHAQRRARALMLRVTREEALLAPNVSLCVARLQASLCMRRFMYGFVLCAPIGVRDGRRFRPIMDLTLLTRVATAMLAAALVTRAVAGSWQRVRVSGLKEEGNHDIRA